jgi:hypothetical protein
MRIIFYFSEYQIKEYINKATIQGSRRAKQGDQETEEGQRQQAHNKQLPPTNTAKTETA